MSRKAWKTLFSLCGEFFQISIFFLCWMFRIEVGLNCYCVVDSELPPKFVYCYEQQIKRDLRGWRVWVNPQFGCFMAVCGHSLNFHVGIWTSHSVCNKDQLCFLLVLFTPKQLFVQHSLYFQNIWNCTDVNHYCSRHTASLCALPLILLHYSKF